LGPGAEKYSGRRLVYEMKKCWISAELVTEFAKELVWAGEHMLPSKFFLLIRTFDSTVSLLKLKWLFPDLHFCCRHIMLPRIILLFSESVFDFLILMKISIFSLIGPILFPKAVAFRMKVKPIKLQVN